MLLIFRTKWFLLGVSNEAKGPEAASAKPGEQVGQIKWWVMSIPVLLYLLLTSHFPRKHNERNDKFIKLLDGDVRR